MIPAPSTAFYRLAIIAIASAVAACAVGPNFERPAAPAVSSFTRDGFPTVTTSASVWGGEPQTFSTDRNPADDWWRIFESPALDRLVAQALRNNPNVASARAALRQAQELVRAQRGFYLPTVQASYSPSRQRTSDTLSPALNSGENIYTLHTAQLTVAYTLDVFGLNRRQVEAFEAQADVQRAQLDAAYLTLTSNVVTAAIQEGSLRAQIAAATDIIEINTKSVELLRKQLAAGAVAGVEVAAQEAALAQAQQALPPLQKQLEQTRDLLAVLTGRLPAEAPSETFELSALRLPTELPIGIPSKLVERRPDIRAAEGQLHAASADIGVAIANMFPQITINAARGGAATQFAEMFSNGNVFWSVSANVAQTLFAGGTLVHRKRAADAAFDQAAAQYKSIVLSAFQNVADVLYALQSDGEALKAAVESERAAKKTLDIVGRQLQVGQVNYLALLSAQQAYQQALSNLAQARAARYADTAALFQALGGSWSTLPEDRGR